MLRNRIRKYLRKLEYLLWLSSLPKAEKKEVVKTVGVLVAINPESNKFKLWHDGFTEAIKMLHDSYIVSLIYFDDSKPESLLQSINQHDFIIVKSSWRTPMDYFLRKHRQFIKPGLGLMISASNKAPSKKEQEFYNVVWYETEWYRKRAIKHSKAFHAFGIDTSIMKPAGSSDYQFDFISVGAPRSYKRLEKLIEKSGRRLLIGDLKNTDRKSNSLLMSLKANGVIVEDFQDYSTLANRYQQSRTCYIPCKTHGGGERSLLEARACGLSVEIESDNPKLKELIDVPIWDSTYYSEQLRKGIEAISQ